MTYRTAIRCDDKYKLYFYELSKSSTLSLTQIMRLALFTAPFSPLFQAQITKFSKDTTETPVPPSPMWKVTEHGLWMDQSYVKTKERESDTIGDTQKIPTIGSRTNEGRIGEVCKVRSGSGGIKITIK